MLMPAFKGLVVRGDGRGRKLGFPTANIQTESSGDKLKEQALGVYVARIKIGGDIKKGIANIGKRPTFNKDGKISLEVHIPGFEGDLYGQTVTVELIQHLRNEIEFGSVLEFKKQISVDVELALKYNA
tara:strand:- start:615 stop:998 length:384 start_codon:yes stop_codon:yes gene_type:complete